MAGAVGTAGTRGVVLALAGASMPVPVLVLVWGRAVMHERARAGALGNMGRGSMDRV
jgi:hypothetical protein